jgi:uncharacterized membrane protein YqaE (UPF0057 family)
MSLGRVILCILFPPLAVLDKGCGSILLVVLLTIAGWVPGVIAALIICKDNTPNTTYCKFISRKNPTGLSNR